MRRRPTAEIGAHGVAQGTYDTSGRIFAMLGDPVVTQA